MHRTSIAIAITAFAAAPGIAQAQTPSAEDSQNAAKHCKQLRTAAGSTAAFTSAVDALVTGKVTARNAYGKCVSFHARDEAKERSSAQKQAVAACKEKKGRERGQCISAAAKARKAAADAADQQKVNAAKECKTERGSTEESRKAFDAKYRNFGRCVSQKAREKNDS